jgi:glycosyltransferase involved in cell wall biosynthesis
MMTGLVDIMMPAYNAELYIAEAIESVLSQSYLNWNLIVVNDGSRDRTAEIVAEYSDSRIKLISQPNSGEATARNTALDHLHGEFVAFLDADDKFLPVHLEAAVNRLRSTPRVDGVYSDGFHIDAKGENGSTLASRRRGPFNGWIFEALVRASDVFGPPLCVVLRREPILKYELRFDNRIVIGPDWDFLTRYAENTMFAYIDQQTCLYRLHSHNITFQTRSQNRAFSLALCREKAIQLASFSRCSLETRAYVFYDLLVELLGGFPERQSELAGLPQFQDLPKDEQARIYRLMASQEIRAGRNYEYVNIWLNKARRLKPGDANTIALTNLFWLSPRLCGLILSMRERLQRHEIEDSPFAQLGTL